MRKTYDSNGRVIGTSKALQGPVAQTAKFLALTVFLVLMVGSCIASLHG